MLREADQALVEWVASVAGETPLHRRPPSAPDDDGPCVLLRLMDIRHAGEQVDRQTNRRKIDFVLSYLLTVICGAEEARLPILEALLVAVLDHPSFQLLPEPPPESFWRSLEFPPHPALRLAVPVQCERMLRPAPLVRERITVNQQRLAKLRGMVVHASGRPVSGVSVRYGRDGGPARTDGRGEFALDGVPADYDPQALAIDSGRPLTLVRVEKQEQGRHGVIIRLDDQES